MNLTIEIPILDKFKKALTPASADSLLRTIAENMLDETRFRIHTEGKNAKGNPIGRYNFKYMPTRAKFGRDGSRNVIFSLTGQMENDWKVIAINGTYGLGFDNPLNTKKAEALQFGQGIYQVKAFQVKSHTRKAHTRTVDGKTISVDAVTVKEHRVKGHTRVGLKGFGVVYQLTDKEKKNIQLIINDWLTRQT